MKTIGGRYRSGFLQKPEWLASTTMWTVHGLSALDTGMYLEPNKDRIKNKFFCKIRRIAITREAFIKHAHARFIKTFFPACCSEKHKLTENKY